MTKHLPGKYDPLKPAEEIDRTTAKRRSIDRIRALARGTSSTLELEEIFHAIAKEVSRWVPFHRISLTLLDDSEEMLELVAVSPTTEQHTCRRARLSVRNSRVGKAVLDRKALTTTHLDKSDQHYEEDSILLSFGILSAVNIPLFSRGSVIGTLNLGRRDPLGFNDGEMEILERVCSEISLSVHNARLYDQATSARNYLQSLVDMAADAIITLDCSGRILSWNRAAEKIFGYLAEEVKGVHVDLLLPADRKHEFLTHCQLVCDGKVIENLETVRQKKDGQLVDVSLSISPIKAVSGQIIGVTKIAKDITARKRLEELSKRKSDEKYRLLFDNASDAIFITDPDSGTVIEANREAELFMGASVEAMRALNPVDFVVPEDRDAFLKFFGTIVREGKVKMGTFSAYRHDGLKFSADVSASLVDYGGRKVIQSIVRDVTERKSAEMELHQRNQQLAVLNEISATVNRSLDLNKTVEDAVVTVLELVQMEFGSVYLINERTRQLELRKQHSLLDSSSRTPCQKQFAEGSVAISPRSVPDTVSILQGSCTVPWSQTMKPIESFGIQTLALVPLKSKDKILGMMQLASCRQRLFSAQEVQMLQSIGNQIGVAVDNARLFEKVKESYEELRHTESQLIHSAKMASLGQLVAGVAHELNNPIGFLSSNLEHLLGFLKDVKNMIQFYDELVADDPIRCARVGQKKEELELDFVLETLERLGVSCRCGALRTKEIVENLRTFSRMDEAVIKEADIHENLDSTLSLLGNQLRDRIVVHRDYGELPLVECNISQLNQVFMNLISNACQAIPNQGEIWVKTRVEDEVLTVSVRDNGTGIPADQLSRIFDPFYTTKEPGKGTGLGLSIAFGIAKDHGGSITVKSEVGQGSTFSLKIPVRRQLIWETEFANGKDAARDLVNPVAPQ
ncbi:MAG: PAS domain S-box protein [Acidobacteriota bacterium]